MTKVKYAVRKYGMEGITVRNISEECNVNDSHLHRFYKNKEELLLEAYKHESTSIFDAMLGYLDEARSVPLDTKSRVRLYFHWTWNEFLSDPARLAFCVYYYHSACFAMAQEFHQSQIETLCGRLLPIFVDREHCEMTMNTLMTLLYDNAKRVIDENLDASEMEERVFVMFYGIVSVQLGLKKSA